MTTDESIMEKMLDRATNPAKESVDELGVQMFCIVVRSNTQLVHKAQEMIVAKVRSTNITEATRAIALLEECMTQCGADFQDEAAKFRFLNELIRLVSKKYLGAETPHEVKQRIMECLLLWTTEFPQRQKIRDAYDMLRKEGDIEHGQSVDAMAKRESVLGTMDEAMFAKLIKSNDPENFKRANLLLQYRMAQEGRRNDLLAQHRCVLEEVRNTIQLLNQMLDDYDPSNADVNETIHELYKSCKKHAPIFQHLPQLLGESDTDLMAETLNANSALLALITRYKEIVPSSKKPTSSQDVSVTTTVTTTTAGTKSAPSASRNDVLVNELLGDFLIGEDDAAKTTNTAVGAPTPHPPNALEDLTDIFNTALADTATAQQQNDPFQYTEILEPEVVSANNNSNGILNGTVSDASNKSVASRKMPQIDILSDELFKTILPTPERVSSFKRNPDKITLNDLARERINAKPNESQVLPTQQTQQDAFDDAPLLGAVAVKQAESIIKTELPAAAATDEPDTTTAAAMVPMTVKHLSEIDIDLDNILATGEQRIVLDDDDLQLSLNFTEDRPSRHVAVIVISAQNKSREPVKDFQFEASVKKPCKVRLLPPTDTGMPPHKPFRPATPINQVMLLLNPTGKPVHVTCIVGYKLGDDPDPIKESIVAKDLPFVE